MMGNNTEPPIEGTWKVNLKGQKGQETEVKITAVFKDVYEEKCIKYIQDTYYKNKKNDFENEIKVENDNEKKYYKHRISLSAEWEREDNKKNSLYFIMFNPSIANPKKSDHTVLNAIKFANKSGYKQIIIYNLFTLRISNPKAINIKSDNNENELKKLNGKDIVFAWGKLPKAIKGIDENIKKLFNKLKENNNKMYQISKDDFQRHLAPLSINNIGGLDKLDLTPIKSIDKIYKFEK